MGIQTIGYQGGGVGGIGGDGLGGGGGGGGGGDGFSVEYYRMDN